MIVPIPAPISELLQQRFLSNSVQAWLTAGIGVVAAAGVIWCAAKVYRIGLLMYGKPPDFATLVRWVRAA